MHLTGCWRPCGVTLSYVMTFTDPLRLLAVSGPVPDLEIVDLRSGKLSSG